MTMGQRLLALRTQAGLSQEALAERLGVSRQSISKWETDASIPDLDKLVRLGEIFGVTLDELVKGGSPGCPDQEPPLPEKASSEQEDRLRRQRLWGWTLLLTAGGLSLLVLGLCPQNLSGFLPAAALVALLGALCFVVRRRLGLVLGWTAWICVFFITTYGSAIHMGSLFTPSYWQNTSLAVPLLALLQLGLLGVLVWRTMRDPLHPAACWMIWLGILASLWLPLVLQMRTFSMSPSAWFRDFFPLLVPAYYQAAPMGAILRWCHLLALVWLVRHSRRSMGRANRPPK